MRWLGHEDMRGLIFILAVVIGCTVRAEQWLPVQDSDLSIERGSVLDFSWLVEEGPAGRHGRVVAQNGHLAFEDGQPQRFLCASKPLGPYSSDDLPDHQSIDLHVRQLRRHGYNLARMALIERALMRGRSEDLDFDPMQLDRFHYLLAALKREGIYWLLYGMTSPRGAFAQGGVNVKQGVYYDPAMRAHWKGLVAKLYGSVNPYTGLRPVEDPALAGFILVNEGGVNFAFRRATELPPPLQALWVQWLKDGYQDTATLSQVWSLGPNESLEQGIIDLPGDDDRSQRMVDLQRFYLSLEEHTLAWMTDHLRQLGYPGLISAYNNQTVLEAQASRAQLDWVDMHKYHDYPTALGRPGSTFKQTSSLADGAQYIQDLSVSRYGGRPYTVTEYGQVFWNSWRRESGIVAPAYARFQGWDMICRMATSPIELSYENLSGKRKDAVYPFAVGMDPVDRAGETLAALLFLRGDVKPADSIIGLEIGPDEVDASAGLGEIPRGLSRLSLISGIGLQWSEEDTGGWTPDAAISLGDSIATDETAITFDGNAFPQLLATLQRRQLIPAGNRTDPESGIFQSDTGELLMEIQDRRFSVVTPKTEGTSFDRNPLQLEQLTVESADGPALVAASSVDDRALAASRRILLILSTDALNTGMRFADASRRTLQDIGSLPVLMRTSRVTLVLRHEHPERLRLYANALNGNRRKALAMEVVEGAVRFTLDTGNMDGGPTTFFELVEPAASFDAPEGNATPPGPSGGGGCSMTTSAKAHFGLAWPMLLWLGYRCRRRLKPPSQAAARRSEVVRATS